MFCFKIIFAPISSYSGNVDIANLLHFLFSMCSFNFEFHWQDATDLLAKSFFIWTFWLFSPITSLFLSLKFLGFALETFLQYFKKPVLPIPSVILSLLKIIINLKLMFYFSQQSLKILNLFLESQKTHHCCNNCWQRYQHCCVHFES